MHFISLVLDKPFRLAAVLVLLGVVACSGSTSPNSPSDIDAGSSASSSSSSSPTANAVVDFTNAERSRSGLTPLRSNSRLMQAAQLQADQMARAGRLDHVLGDATYPRPEDRLAAVGYRWQAYAENVAFNQRGPEEVVDAWMQSSGHRANIMNASLTEIGAGYARDSSGRPYWAQVFGRPAQ